MILLIPTINQWFEIWVVEELDENKAKVKYVEINVERLDNFPQEYEAYYNEHFSFKPFAIEIMSFFKEQMFDVSINDGAHLGDDNFVFDGKGSRFTIRKEHFDFTQKIQLELEWERRLEYLRKKNIPCFWFIIPNKSDLYFEKLPWNLKRRKRTPSIGQQFGSTNNHVISLYDALFQGKNKGKVYYKTDTHWSVLGAELGYIKIIETLQKNGYDVQPFNKGEIQFYAKEGNLRKNIPSSKFKEELEIWSPDKSYYEELPKFGFDIPEVFPYKSAYEVHFQSKWSGKSDLKVLIIRDSFTNFILHRLAVNFKESLFIWDNWQYELNEEIIEKYKPDLILYITIDNLIPNLLKAINGEAYL